MNYSVSKNEVQIRELDGGMANPTFKHLYVSYGPGPLLPEMWITRNRWSPVQPYAGRLHGFSRVIPGDFLRRPRIPLHSQQQPPSKFKNDTAQHSTQHTAADQAHSSRPATQQQTPTQHELQHRQRARWSRGSGRSHVAGDDHTAVVVAVITGRWHQFLICGDNRWVQPKICGYPHPWVLVVWTSSKACGTRCCTFFVIDR